MGESRRRADAEAATLALGLDLGLRHVDTAEMYGGGGAEEMMRATRAPSAPPTRACAGSARSTSELTWWVQSHIHTYEYIGGRCHRAHRGEAGEAEEGVVGSS